MRETEEQRLEQVGQQKGWRRRCQKEVKVRTKRRRNSRKGIKGDTSKDTKAFAKNGVKNKYFWTQKILKITVSSKTDIIRGIAWC